MNVLKKLRKSDGQPANKLTDADKLTEYN